MDRFAAFLLPIDGKWTLDDLYRFPRAFEQVYYAVEAIRPTSEFGSEERVARAFQALPWRGGYSAVSFYNQLKFATPTRNRPKILSIKYASPGWLELWLNLPQAVQVGSIVASVAGNILFCNNAYNKIYADMQRRKMLRMDVEERAIRLTREQIKIVKEGADTMSSIMNLQSPDALHRRTDDPLKSLKILLSVYRRVRLMAEYQNKRKVKFDDVNSLPPPDQRQR